MLFLPHWNWTIKQLWTKKVAPFSSISSFHHGIPMYAFALISPQFIYLVSSAFKVPIMLVLRAAHKLTPAWKVLYVFVSLYGIHQVSLMFVHGWCFLITDRAASACPVALHLAVELIRGTVVTHGLHREGPESFVLLMKIPWLTGASLLSVVILPVSPRLTLLVVKIIAEIFLLACLPKCAATFCIIDEEGLKTF